MAQALAPGGAQVRRAEEEEDERPDPVRVQPRALPTAEEARWLCRRRRRQSERPCSGARGEMLRACDSGQYSERTTETTAAPFGVVINW